MSHCDVRHFFTKYIDVEKNENSKNWWTKDSDIHNGTYYHGNVVKVKFDEWIKSGMID
ncbi:hypothetical protein [Staphylococcus aureus]|uniref:hypothetical protein n=1 Tax=Staphylococcus aureus TaxID=1280 RepID=UPI002108A677|nr:hypothetical protein [Staphylococcus aureus]